MITSFRDSEFIDFNTGVVKIRPMTLINSLLIPWTLNDKILVFHCRVEVWQLGVAVQILKQIESDPPRNSIWAHSAYGVISIICSYFEMIGKTLNPDSTRFRSAKIDFNYGFCDVYPEYASSDGQYKDASLPMVKEFRNRVRNGMYHLAATKRDLIIHNNPTISTKDYDVIHRTENSHTVNYYCVNPHSMVRRIVDHFPTFIDQLKNTDTKYDEMREKFEEFMDDYHDA